MAILLNYWNVLALEIKYHPDTKASKRWELLNRKNSCKLDGLRTVAKPKQKFYMKGLLIIACITFLQQGRLFPTSVASFWVTKFILLSQDDKRTFVQQLRPRNPALHRDKVTTRRCGTSEAGVRRVYFRRETKRKENSAFYQFELLFLNSFYFYFILFFYYFFN